MVILAVAPTRADEDSVTVEPALLVVVTSTGTMMFSVDDELDVELDVELAVVVSCVVDGS